MKAWQDLTMTLLETVFDGDKIFHGVSKVTDEEKVSTIPRPWQEMGE